MATGRKTFQRRDLSMCMELVLVYLGTKHKISELEDSKRFFIRRFEVKKSQMKEGKLEWN